MSRTSNCIRMLQMLNRGGIIKISDLASELETSPRNIIEYRKELEYAGYFIETIPGKYGGYKLDRSYCFPALKLLENEKNSIFKAVDFISNNISFHHVKDYLSAMNKICSSFNSDDINTSSLTYIDRFPLFMPVEELSYRYNEITKAINLSKTIIITYLSNDNTYKEREVEPHKLFMYNNAWFVLAYCKLAKDYRYFKLCRIKTMEITDKKFRKSVYYNEHEFLNNFGMTQNGDWYDVKLRFVGKAAMYVKDYSYGQDQTIEECVDGSTIISVKMQYKDNITKFVLNYGIECEVIEPEWLKEEVYKQICLMKDKYERK